MAARRRRRRRSKKRAYLSALSARAVHVHVTPAHCPPPPLLVARYVYLSISVESTMSPKYDIGQRIRKFFPRYNRHFTGYVLEVIGPERDCNEEVYEYVIYYPEDGDDETMAEDQVKKWGNGKLGDGGEDNLGGGDVDDEDLIVTLLRHAYAKQDDGNGPVNIEKPSLAQEPTGPQEGAKRGTPNSQMAKKDAAKQPKRPVHKYRVGQRVSKYFVTEGQYFNGTIDELLVAGDLVNSDPGAMYYHIKYDDDGALLVVEC